MTIRRPVASVRALVRGRSRRRNGLLGIDAIRLATALRPRLLILDVGSRTWTGTMCADVCGQPATADPLFCSCQRRRPLRRGSRDSTRVPSTSVKPFEPRNFLARVDAQLELVTLREAWRAAIRSWLARTTNSGPDSAASRVKRPCSQAGASTPHSFAWRCIIDQLGATRSTSAYCGGRLRVLRSCASGHGFPRRCWRSQQGTS